MTSHRLISDWIHTFTALSIIHGPHDVALVLFGHDQNNLMTLRLVDLVLKICLCYRGMSDFVQILERLSKINQHQWNCLLWLQKEEEVRLLVFDCRFPE